MPASATAFAPGRVNLLGEHTDYNGGLCLPFSLSRGVTVRAERLAGERTLVHTDMFDEHDQFWTRSPERTDGWRAFARGVVSELLEAGHDVPSARLEIASDLPAGTGLASSAALEVALALALLALAGKTGVNRLALARLCSRVEHLWVGAQTGLLDQLATLAGERDMALLIDFERETIEHTRLALGGWVVATIESGADRSLAGSGYNERVLECRRAAELLGLGSLRAATGAAVEQLPEPYRRRARYVLRENQRVRAASAALRAGDLDRLAGLLSAGHASMRDDLEVSVPQVEATVKRALSAGARGAKLMGGGFGGSVLALFPPAVELPQDAVPARSGPPASLL